MDTNKQIKGSVSVTRHATVGGKVLVLGDVTVTGDLRAEGWLDAPNIKAPCKGLFADAEALAEAHPKPQPGWYALVGTSLPAQIYGVADGKWYDTGGEGGELQVIGGGEHPVTTKDTDRADLILADEDENPIAVFAAGHIRTANFNSAAITQSYPLAGLRLSILGDSISTFDGYTPQGYNNYYPRPTLSSVEQTWWHRVIDATGMTLLRNASWGGSTVCGDSTSTTNALAGCSTKRIADLSDGDNVPDVVIIWIGINDWGTLDARLGDWSLRSPLPSDGQISNFSDAYALMLSKVMRAYPLARVYCCTLLDTVYTGYAHASSSELPRHTSSGQTYTEYNQRISEIAHSMGASVIDTHSCGITVHNASTYLIDGLHPNAQGTALVAEKVIQKVNGKW